MPTVTEKLGSFTVTQLPSVPSASVGQRRRFASFVVGYARRQKSAAPREALRIRISMNYFMAAVSDPPTSRSQVPFGTLIHSFASASFLP
jgi:hypothetical protein